MGAKKSWRYDQRPMKDILNSQPIRIRDLVIDEGAGQPTDVQAQGCQRLAQAVVVIRCIIFGINEPDS
jgi:hypothetical protein